MACPQSRSADGYELQFATNHLSHFLLTNLLLPALKAGAPARIVNVSSLAHTMAPVDFDDIHFERRRYGRWIAYAQSKTANVLFTVELQRRLQLLGISAFAVHPGVILTNLVRHINAPAATDTAATDNAAAPPPPRTDARPARPRRTPPEAMKSVEQGAATTLFAALSPSLDGRGGLYLEDCKYAGAPSAGGGCAAALTCEATCRPNGTPAGSPQSSRMRSRTMACSRTRWTPSAPPGCGRRAKRW